MGGASACFSTNGGGEDWDYKRPPACPSTAPTHTPTIAHESLPDNISYGALVRCPPLLAAITRPRFPVSLFPTTFSGLEPSVDGMAKLAKKGDNREAVGPKRVQKNQETRTPQMHPSDQCNEQPPPSLQHQSSFPLERRMKRENWLLRHAAQPPTSGTHFLRLRHAGYRWCLPPTQQRGPFCILLHGNQRGLWFRVPGVRAGYPLRCSGHSGVPARPCPDTTRCRCVGVGVCGWVGVKWPWFPTPPLYTH